MVIIRKKHVETALEKESRQKKEALASSGIQDQYQARGFELVSWVQDHKVIVSAMIGLFIVGGLVLSGYYYYQQRTNEEATSKFLMAIKDIDGELKEGENKKAKLEKARTDLQEVAHNFPRTKVSLLANIYAGHIALEIDDAKTALTAYQNALNGIKKSDPLYVLALIGLGYAQERNGDVTAALLSFEAAINNKETMNKELPLFEAARLANELKENDKAKQYRERLLKDFPNSVYEKNLTRLAIE